MTHSFSAAGRSDTGLVRVNNEDSWWAAPDLVAVSDGVGGRPAGEVASRLATTVVRLMAAHGVPLDRAIEAAGQTVNDLAAANPLFTGMCCTFTAAGFVDGRVVVAHVGDSRAWLVRGGRAERLTQDQTIAARLLARGEISAEEAAVHPRRATLFQAVGMAIQLDVAMTPLEVEDGDRLVLATDGIAYAGDDAAVDALITKDLPADALADAVVAAALAGGGNDNVTVVVADVVGAAA